MIELVYGEFNEVLLFLLCQKTILVKFFSMSHNFNLLKLAYAILNVAKSNCYVRVVVYSLFICIIIIFLPLSHSTCGRRKTHSSILHVRRHCIIYSFLISIIASCYPPLLAALHYKIQINNYYVISDRVQNTPADW